MRLLPVLTTVLLSLGVTACGGTGKATQGTSSTSKTSANVAAGTTPATTTTSGTTSGTTSTKHSLQVDSDGDGDKNVDDYAYGQAASAADSSAIIALVKSYYAAAAAADGAKACTLIYSLFAEEIPELYGEASGPAYLRGTSCPVVMSKLFKLHHQELAVDLATLKVSSTRIKRLRALALMSFKGRPRRDILVHREHSVWKIDELLDTELG